MKPIYETLARVVAELPMDRVQLAADQFARMPTRNISLANVLAAWGKVLSALPLVKDFCSVVVDAEMAPGELASAMYGAIAASRNPMSQSKLDILWTGPQTSAVPVRRNEQALCELIDSAKESLFVVSYVSYKADKVFKAIGSAIARGVKVSFLLETSKNHGLDKSFPDACFYEWGNGDGSETKSVMHVKCAVADKDMALVTSANLTGSAMDDNMELGVLIKGGRVPAALHDHFMALAVEGTIKRIH